MIVSTSILIEAALELLGLTYLIIDLIVLLLRVLSAISASVHESSSSCGLALSIGVGVVPTLLANEYLLSIVLEEVHSSVRTCSLLEVYHILGLLEVLSGIGADHLLESMSLPFSCWIHIL